MVARVYPVTDQGRSIYHGMDGKTTSSISIESPDWQHVMVWDVTGDKEVPHQKARHAVEFEMSAGHDYVIK